jgi:hypothetical protein
MTVDANRKLFAVLEQLRVLGCAPGNFNLLFYDAEKRAVSA